MGDVDSQSKLAAIITKLNKNMTTQWVSKWPSYSLDIFLLSVLFLGKKCLKIHFNLMVVSFLYFCCVCFVQLQTDLKPDIIVGLHITQVAQLTTC